MLEVKLSMSFGNQLNLEIPKDLQSRLQLDQEETLVSFYYSRIALEDTSVEE